MRAVAPDWSAVPTVRDRPITGGRARSRLLGPGSYWPVRSWRVAPGGVAYPPGDQRPSLRPVLELLALRPCKGIAIVALLERFITDLSASCWARRSRFAMMA
jgi:hypothetical protein